MAIYCIFVLLALSSGEFNSQKIEKKPLEIHLMFEIFPRNSQPFPLAHLFPKDATKNNPESIKKLLLVKWFQISSPINANK